MSIIPRLPELSPFHTLCTYCHRPDRCPLICIHKRCNRRFCINCCNILRKYCSTCGSSLFIQLSSVRSAAACIIFDGPSVNPVPVHPVASSNNVQPTPQYIQQTQAVVPDLTVNPYNDEQDD